MHYYNNIVALRGNNPLYSFFSRHHVQPEEYGGLMCRGNETSLQSCSVDDYYVERHSSLQYNFGYAQVSCLPRTHGMYHRVGRLYNISIYIGMAHDQTRP